MRSVVLVLPGAGRARAPTCHACPRTKTYARPALPRARYFLAEGAWAKLTEYVWRRT